MTKRIHHKIIRHGGAPPWRRLFLHLGFENADPTCDGTRSARIKAQASRRSPRQLLSALETISSSLSGFGKIIQRADRIRAERLRPAGGDDVALRELNRFITISGETVEAILSRRPNKLDDTRIAHELYIEASRLSVVLRPMILRFASTGNCGEADLWREPVAAPRSRALLMIFTSLAAAVAAVSVLIVALT